MYHKIEDQEKNPDSYVLTQMDPSILEDECYDLLTKPRQTQRTIGLYLKKMKDSVKPPQTQEQAEQKPVEKKKFKLTKGSHGLEREMKRNKGLWIEKPQNSAPLIWKLKEKFSVDIPQKSRKGKGIFYRPDFLELDYVIKLANAGLLYPDEEVTDSEEEIEPDMTPCLPLRKIKYKICDPCKSDKERKEKAPEVPPKDLIEEMTRKGEKPPFKKIPTGCQCDYFGEHDEKPTVWDNPFRDRLDMLRQHEMNKVLRPYKRELLNQNYEKNPPVKFMAHEYGMKRTFPEYGISNL